MTDSSYVRYIGASIEQIRWGSCDDPRELLNVNQVYEVESREVYSWHTKIKLVGIDGWFNSVCFEPWLTPTEQAAMDARPGKPDASGAQEEMMDCYQFGTVPAHDKQQPAQRHQLSERNKKYADQLSAHMDEGGEYGVNNVRDLIGMVFEMADALDAQAAEIAAYERLDEEGYASLAVDLAAAEQRIADLEYANSDTAGEQQLRIFAKQNAALREALARLTNAVSLGRIGPKPSKIGGVPRYEFSKRQNDILEIAFAKARAALEAGDE